MKSLHTFVPTVTEKMFSKTVKAKARCYNLIKTISRLFQCQFENAREMENETWHPVPEPFSFFLFHCWATREWKRRGNQLPGGNSVYISHLTYCKCYINISHWVDLTQASVESSTNYHSRKRTNTQKHTHTVCIYSTSMPPADLHRPPVRTDNSMPTPACISYLVGTGLLTSYFHNTSPYCWV